MLLLLDISRWKISNVDMSWLFYQATNSIVRVGFLEICQI
jgi:hypothetical protein